MNTIRKFNHSIKQDGVYVFITQEPSQTSYANVVVYESNDGKNYISDALKDNNSFIGTPSYKHKIWVFGVRLWIAGVYSKNDIVWHKGQSYLCVATTTSDEPGASSDWNKPTPDEVQSAGNLIQTTQGDAASDYFFTPVLSESTGDFVLLNRGNHNWNISYTEGVITNITLNDYNMGRLESWSVNDNTFNFTTPEDGAYILTIVTDNDATHYIEVYDFTDIENCYLELVRTVLCDCIDCNDCPGPQYQRALTFSNMYMLIRDILYSDRWAAGGFVSTEILRSDYVTMYGIIIEKLKEVSSKCNCNDR